MVPVPSQLRRLRFLDGGISQRLTGPKRRERWVQRGSSTARSSRRAWRSESVRGQTAESPGGRERSAGADAGRFYARQRRVKDLSGKSGDARGTTGGDDVSRQAFEMSERRACRVIGTDRTSGRYSGRASGRRGVARVAESPRPGATAFRLPSPARSAAAGRPCHQQETGPGLYCEERLVNEKRSSSRP
jgi:hypothetical protein